MDEDIEIVPMRSVKDILADIEEQFDAGGSDGKPPCPKCNGTGTELVYVVGSKIPKARRCDHGN